MKVAQIRHTFGWGPEQEKALTEIKEILSTAPALSYFDPTVTSTIQADTSQYGLGACLLQKGKPVAYASRSLNPAECNYAQTSKLWPIHQICKGKRPTCGRCAVMTLNKRKDLEFSIYTMIQNLLASDEKKSRLQAATVNDHQCQQLLTLMRSGWPTDVSNVPISLRDYWKVKHNLFSADNLIFIHNWIVIPSTMWPEILKCIHEGHMRIEKCKARARMCV